MTTRNMCLLIILGMFLTFTFTGKPSDAQLEPRVPLGKDSRVPREAHEFTIHVSVNCDDIHTQPLMQSWIKRELRSLGDVRIVNFDKALYIFRIAAVEPKYKTTGRKAGNIAVASMFFMKSTFHANLYYEPQLRVFADNTKNLEDLCKHIVASTDTHDLEPVRELFQ